MKCDNCKKGIMYGHNVSHSKRRTRRIFKPNLHKARIKVWGSYKRMKLCAKCLRKLKTPALTRGGQKSTPINSGSKLKSESKKSKNLKVMEHQSRETISAQV